MSATYTNDPGNRPIDTVRFEVDDRDCIPETDALLSDEEIQYLIDSNTHILLAAAAAADAIAAQYGDTPQRKQVGDLVTDYGDGLTTSYAGLAKALRSRAYRKAGTGIYAGGISKTDKDTMEDDTDRVQPVFTIGQHDSPGTGSSHTVDRGIIDY